MLTRDKLAAVSIKHIITSQIRTAFGLEFFGHVEAPLLVQLPIPTGASMVCRWIRVDQFSSADAISSVVDTHAWPVETWHRARVTSANVISLETPRYVNLLLQGHLGDQCARLLVSRCPSSMALTFRYILPVSIQPNTLLWWLLTSGIDWRGYSLRGNKRK